MYNDAANPVLVGGAGITFLRSFAGIVAGDIAGTIDAGARMGAQLRPLTECATCPPAMAAPVVGSVYPIPVATHVPTPDASTPHAMSVPDTAKTPAPVPAAQFAPSYE